ncbi:type II toxin-antitoxin system RelE/ParE family toxin [Massilia sp. Root418]|uniref:type II toxin-antitoxin system RelE/ParE family toxin n=1 Tax=Massilia sp. Root418 TaxID=1736532 RepID=UPI0027D7790C|nr:type II toxin-antitoxin system RelE/ParE family toxin [Massilia sp. Root418]
MINLAAALEANGIGRPGADYGLHRQKQPGGCGQTGRIELIRQKVEQLILRPTLYRVGRKPGTREMVIHPNYLVIYRTHKGCIEILRVKHAARKIRY